MTDQTLDPAIISALPAGSENISVTTHGEVNWAAGYRIELSVNGSPKSYFLKIFQNAPMAEAEFQGQQALSAIIPANASAPLARGFLDRDSTQSWYLTPFLDLTPGRPPALADLLPVIRKLHQGTSSPNGKFGFPVQPFYGRRAVDATWTDTWEAFWTRLFRDAVAFAQETHGADGELERLAAELADKVVPRLLRPLHGGIRPVLCHGDLWEGNIQVEQGSGRVVLFDPCPMYGHHEVDFQAMRAPEYRQVGREFVELYRREVGASAPEGDFDDRNALYSVRTYLMVAGMWEKKELIGRAKDEMRRLIEKHPDGLAGFEGPWPGHRDLVVRFLLSLLAGLRRGLTR